MSVRRAQLIAVVFVVVYLGLQLAGLRAAPLTDDDDFYIPAGISYAQWLGRLVDGQGALDRSVIDAAFDDNKEHPPLAKYVFGVCHFAFRAWLGPTDSARVGTVLFSTLTAWLLLSLAIRHLGGARGLRVGGLAVLALLTLPRFYFHSHAATLDVPVAAMYLWAASVTLRAERSTLAAIMAGVVFGLAAATKLNGPFLALAYLLFVLLTRGLWRKPKVPDLDREPGFVIPPIPLALLSMALLGPLTFWAVWPWIWHDTVARVGEYVGFHLNHYPIYFLYLGHVYAAKPFAPWHAPFLTTLATVPLSTLVLAAGGFLAAWPAIRLRLRFLSGPDDDFRKEGDLWLFVLINAALTIGVVAFAGTPIYGGEKLFTPFFPFLCLLAGGGANMLWERLDAGLASSGLRKVVPAAVALSGVLAGGSLVYRFWGYPLSSFNGAIDGLRGATALGLERQYYDLAFRDLVAYLSAEGPPNLKVHFLPNNWEYVRTYKWYAQAGELRRDVQVVSSESQADWIIITHERRFARYGDDLARYRGKPIIREHTVDGTPIWSIVRAR